MMYIITSGFSLLRYYDHGTWVEDRSQAQQFTLNVAVIIARQLQNRYPSLFISYQPY